VKAEEPENLPVRPLFRTAPSWMTSTLYTADSTNIHKVSFIYWRKLGEFHKFSLLTRGFMINPSEGWLYHGNCENFGFGFLFLPFLKSINGAKTCSITEKFNKNLDMLNFLLLFI